MFLAVMVQCLLWYDNTQVLRLQYQKELAQAHVTTQTKFNYAWGLVKSPIREHQVEGVRLLQGAYILAIESWFPYSICDQRPNDLSILPFIRFVT